MAWDFKIDAEHQELRRTRSRQLVIDIACLADYRADP